MNIANELTGFNSLMDLMDFFKSEDSCKAYLARIRWNENPTCPHCGCQNAYTTNRGYKCSDKDCQKKFSVTVGTYFENTKVKLRKWFISIYLDTSHKKGISSCQLAKHIKVQQRTAWFMLHRIREMVKEKSEAVLFGEVEIDETYMGGKSENKPKHKRTGKQEKTPVMGFIQRGSKVVTRVLPKGGADRWHMMPLIDKLVSRQAHIITDGLKVYLGLDKKFASHTAVPHQKEIYGIGTANTNSIEGFFSMLKRAIYGIYHHASDKHLNKYISEVQFRYNNRNLTDSERFVVAITQCEGRLSYQELTRPKK